MQKNYSQGLEMQIPQENTYTGLENSVNLNNELEELSKKYHLRRVEELKAYIVKDNRIIPYINSITPLIIEYFPDNKRYLTYCKDPEFKDLSKAKICIIGNDSLFEEERELMNVLNEKLLHMKNYPSHVKNSISVRLWWLWPHSTGRNSMMLEIIWLNTQKRMLIKSAIAEYH